jgi:hypothetical protein
MDLISRKAREAGIDPTHALTMASIETGGKFDPQAVSPTGYKGLYQFGPGEWRTWGGGKDIFDPEANVDAFVGYHGELKDQLKASLGRDPTPQELYLAWQQGGAGAPRLLGADPNAKASTIVPVANIVANGGTPDMTVGDFVNLWRKRYGEHQETIVPGMGPSQYVGPAPEWQPSTTPGPPQPVPVPSAPAINPAGLLSERYNPYASGIKTGMGLLEAGNRAGPQMPMPGLLQPYRPQGADFGLPGPGRRGLLG